MRTFEEHLREAGLAPRTIKTYTQVVTAWLESGLEPRQYCARGDPSGNTHNQRAAAIRHYYIYCEEPPPEIPAWKRNTPPPRYLSPDDVRRLLAEISHYSSREYAAACLIYSAGLRIGEIVLLELENLDLDSRYVRVHGKGGKVRQVPFDEEVTARALRQFLGWARPKLEQPDSPGRVFLADRGGQYREEALTEAIRWAAARLGLPEFDRPAHQLRHCYATHLLEGDLNIRQVQELLGHVDLNTTQIYTQVCMGSIREKYDAAHPLAKKRGKLELVEEKIS